MKVPKYDEMYNVYLEVLSDKKEHESKEIKEEIAKKLKLSEEDMIDPLNSEMNILYCRLYWTTTYLKHAGLIDTNKKGIFFITEEGEKVYNKDKIDNKYLLKYPSFVEFINKKIIKE